MTKIKTASIVFGTSIIALAVLTLSPAIAEVLGGEITEATLKDHAAGNNPAKNPAHYELIVNATGNYTQYAIDATTAGSNATGFGIINNTDYVWAFTSHVFDDCNNPEDCGNYLPHGHQGQLIPGPTENCTTADAELTMVSDLGEAKVKVSDGEEYSIVELDDIPADAMLNLEENICDIDHVDDVANVTSFTININATGGNALCVHVDSERSLDTVEGEDGPNQNNNPNAKNPNKPNRVGGFESTGNEASFCPTGP